MANKFAFNPLSGQFDLVSDTSGFVPYTGATSDVDLSTYSLSAYNLTASNKLKIKGTTDVGTSATIGDLSYFTSIQTENFVIGDNVTTDFANLLHMDAGQSTARAGFILSNSSNDLGGNWSYNFAQILVNGSNFAGNYYPTALGASSDAGKGIMLFQSNNYSLTEILLGASGYNGVPVSITSGNAGASGIIATFNSDGYGTTQFNNAVKLNATSGSGSYITLDPTASQSIKLVGYDNQYNGMYFGNALPDGQASFYLQNDVSQALGMYLNGSGFTGAPANNGGFYYNGGTSLLFSSSGSNIDFSATHPNPSMRIIPDGRVFIDTTSTFTDNGAMLNVAGTGIFETSITVNNTSNQGFVANVGSGFGGLITNDDTGQQFQFFTSGSGFSPLAQKFYAYSSYGGGTAPFLMSQNGDVQFGQSNAGSPNYAIFYCLSDFDNGGYSSRAGIRIDNPVYTFDIKGNTNLGYDIGNSTSGLWNITNAGEMTAASFIKSGATSADVLMGDGSATTGFTGTVTTASLVGKTITITNGIVTSFI